MTAKFKKDVLYAGKWRLPDGRDFVVTREEIAHFSQRARDMQAAGLSIPLAWEHQDDAKPMTAAEKKANSAKFNCGWQSDVLPSGNLMETVFEVPVADDAARLPAARFISPEIQNDFVDGTGRLWPGPSITHYAVTARPVQIPQGTFTPVSLSHGRVRLSLEAWDGYDSVRLGADMPFPKKKKKPPVEDDADVTPEADDEGEPQGGQDDDTGAGDDLPGGGDDDADTGIPGADDDGDGDVDDIGEGDDDGNLGLAGGGSSQDARVSELIAHLAEMEHPLVLPPDTDASNLIDRLDTAVLTALAHQGKNPNGEDDEDQDGPGNNNNPNQYTDAAMSTPVMMSQNALTKQVVKLHKKDLDSRIEKLANSGRITRKLAKELQTELTTVRLSLDGDGEPTMALDKNGKAQPCKLVNRIEAYEALDAGMAFTDDDAVRLSLEDLPSDATGTPEDNKKAVEECIQTMSRGAAGRARTKTKKDAE